MMCKRSHIRTPENSTKKGCKECIKLLYQQAHPKRDRTRCKRGHERTPESVTSNGTCRLCGQLLYRQKHPRTRAEAMAEIRAAAQTKEAIVKRKATLEAATLREQ